MVPRFEGISTKFLAHNFCIWWQIGSLHKVQNVAPDNEESRFNALGEICGKFNFLIFYFNLILYFHFVVFVSGT